MKYLKTTMASVAFALAATGMAQATIVSAVGATITSGGVGFGSITDTHNQAGLSAGYTNGDDFAAVVAGISHTNTFASFEWFSDSGTTSASVTYDLGSVLSIDAMALWNEESSGIGLLDLLWSIDGTTFSSLLTGLTPTDNTVGPNYFADVFGFATTSLQYVRMDMSRCPQPLPGSFSACAIGEVAFNQVAAVPVPAAGLMLMGALGGLGLMRRRRHAA